MTLRRAFLSAASPTLRPAPLAGWRSAVQRTALVVVLALGLLCCLTCPAAVAGQPVDGSVVESTTLLAIVPPGVLAAPPPLAPPSPASAAPLRDTIYLVDVSSSMAGEPLARAQAALLVALGRLAPEERLSLVAFSADTVTLFPGGAPADLESLEVARRWVAGLRAGGGDDMLRGLDTALVPGEAGVARQRQVVLISDGLAGDDEQALGLVATRLAGARLFTVGVGDAAGAESGFLARAAALGGGAYVEVADPGLVATRMGELLWRLQVRPAPPAPSSQAAGVAPGGGLAAISSAAAGEPVTWTPPSAAFAGRGRRLGGALLLLACLALTATWVLAPRPRDRPPRPAADRASVRP